MNGKKLFLAGLAGFVVMFSISGLWYEVLMADYYRAHFADVVRVEPLMLWIVVGYLVASFLLAYIYPLGYKGGTPAKEGLRFGLFMGLIMALPFGLIMYGVHTVPLTGSLIDIIYQVVEKTIGCIVIAYVYASGTKAKAD